MSDLTFILNAFQRRAVEFSGLRAICETEDDRFRSFQLGQPAPYNSKSLLTPEGSLTSQRSRFYRELHDLSDRAGLLAAKLIRSGRYKCDSVVLIPVWEGLGDFWETEVWLRFLLHTHANDFHYSHGEPGDPSPVLFGVGKVIAWIDRYPQVCAEALAKLRVGAAETKRTIPPAPTAIERKQTVSKSKKSTKKGEGRAKLIAALTKHHRYAEDSALNHDPINNNKLAQLAGVDKATASAFFKKEFGDHQQYTVMCRDAVSLIASLKHLNGEYTARALFGRGALEEGSGNDGE